MRKVLILFTIWVALSGVTIGLLYYSYQISSLVEEAPQRTVSLDQIWSITYGTRSGNDAGVSVIDCQEGGFLLAGSIWARNSRDVLLIRVDDNGRILWNHIIGDPGIQIAASVIECDSGGFAILGSTLSSTLDYDALLIRIDSDGNLLWSHSYGARDSDRGNSLLECSDGGFAFAGFTANYGVNQTDFWLVRTDAEGNSLWNRTYGGNDYDICYSMIHSDSDGFVLAGTTESFGAGNEDVWMICTDSEGSVVWQQMFGGYREDICRQIIRNQNDGYILMGTTQQTANLVEDAFAIATHLDGTEIWNTSYGGNTKNTGNSITKCLDGGYAITGSVLEWENGQVVTNLYVTRLNSEGTFLWKKSYGGFDLEVGWSIIQTFNGDFVIAGATGSFAVGGMDAWLLRIPDVAPPVFENRDTGSPNFHLMIFGTVLATVVTLGTYVLYYQSHKDISMVILEESKKELKHTALVPRMIDELKPILTGSTRCRACGTINEQAKFRCTKCKGHLHWCTFCTQFLNQEDLVIFCPTCGGLAHHEHMKSELGKPSFCPLCGNCLCNPAKL